MYKKYAMIFILFITIVMTGCNNNEIVNEDVDNQKSKVTIEGYYNEPNSLMDKETILLEGLQTGEFLEIIIYGEIKNFEHIRVEYDDETNTFKEVEVLNSYDELSNKTIVIKTYMPEGIPSELIKWESNLGEDYQFYIREIDLSDNAVRILEFNMNE